MVCAIGRKIKICSRLIRARIRPRNLKVIQKVARMNDDELRQQIGAVSMYVLTYHQSEDEKDRSELPQAHSG